VPFLFVLFLFRAEDGIRVVEKSRGLGDVYKLQMRNWETNPNLLAAVEMMEGAIALREMDKEIRLAAIDLFYEDV